MKAAAVVIGVLAVAGLIVLAVAGMSGALGVLLTAGAVVCMVALGGVLGGRHTPEGPSRILPQDGSAERPEP
jgi:peptidoglycan/LPS O-acetylase OafA/YrhL